MADEVDEVAQDGADEATRAFRALTREVADARAELSIMRRAIEDIGPALADARVPDYSPTLAEIAAAQEAMLDAITNIERHPAIQVGPEAYVARTAQVIEQAGRGRLRDAESTAQAIQGTARVLEGMLGSARTRRAQNRRLVQAAAVGIAAGLVCVPLLGFPLARGLPFGSLPDTLAASALGADRWSAGMGLMQRADPPRWNSFVASYRMAEAGGLDLKNCYETVSRTAQEQRCTVTIRPPGGR